MNKISEGREKQGNCAHLRFFFFWLMKESMGKTKQTLLKINQLHVLEILNESYKVISLN